MILGASLLAGCKPGSPRGKADSLAALARESGCMRCHDVVRHYVGPSFAQIAERYRGDAGAPQRLADHIQHGSAGRWGNAIMPRHPYMTPADAGQLAQWVLRQPENTAGR